MAEKNLMDYSLLLITETNPDFKENESHYDSRGSRAYKSVKSVGGAIRQDS